MQITRSIILNPDRRTMLEEYTDDELIQELKKRKEFYMKIGDLTFYYDSMNELLAVKIANNEHPTAEKGDFWVLNGSYPLRSAGTKGEYWSIDSGKRLHVKWEEIKGKNVKKYLGDAYFEYVSDGFMEAMKAD